MFEVSPSTIGLGDDDILAVSRYSSRNVWSVLKASTRMHEKHGLSSVASKETEFKRALRILQRSCYNML
jgi:hypothetical protein